MAEEQVLQQQTVTQEGQPQTQQVTTVEENNPTEGIKQDVDNINGEPAGASGSEVNPQGDSSIPDGEQTTPTAPVSDESLKNKLKEYELKEQEIENLRKRLGFDSSTPSEVVQLQSIEATFENQAVAEWNRLCSQYGVDTSSQGFDQSVKALLEKDPKAYYEFEAKAERLSTQVNNYRRDITAQRNMFETRKALAPHIQLYENSPAVANIVNGYVQANIASMRNPQAEINGLMEAIKGIYLEAYEVGKQSAKLATAQQDTSGLNTSIAGAGGVGNYPISDEHIFTRKEIANMSLEEYERNSSKIDKQLSMGLIK